MADGTGRTRGRRRISGKAAPSGLNRRRFLQLAGVAGAGALLPGVRRVALGADAPALAVPPEEAFGPPVLDLVRFPQKAELLMHTDRPPNLESPIKYFREDLTPNDQFFVRWHLGVIPTSVDAGAFRLTVGGHVETPLSLSLDALRKEFEPVSVIAVNQCSGNSRSYFNPRVPGGQWGNGAMGNARWTGVRLKDLLAKAKSKAGALEVTFQGLDRGPLPTVPDFVKSLSMDRSNDGELLVAYEMNGQPLPMLNGFPLRLIVPGWFATYWVKSLTKINVVSEKFTGFWMAKAYRVPNNPEMQEAPKELAKETVPITRMPVRSIFLYPEAGQKLPPGQVCKVEGLALDSGSGIRNVELSADGGKTWAETAMQKDLGNYAWRRWRADWTPAGPGQHTLMARATSNAGETQPAAPRWNRSGYARNVIETLPVNAA